MQAKKAGEHELVEICMAELCKNAGFADNENLVQRDLQFLCDSIETKTGVLISLSTIRRLLNGQFSRLPQIATLDSIAITAGYPSWQHFKIDKSSKNGTVNQQEDGREQLLRPAGIGNKFFNTRNIVQIGVLLLVILVLLALMKIGKTGPGNIDKARFSYMKVSGNDIPNSVVFYYNIDSVAADSFFIQQSWDRNRRVKIFKHKYTLTDIYYEPGYHIAKLIANDKIIKTLDVSIPTNKWFFYAEEAATEGQPEYILAPGGFKNGHLKLTMDDLAKSKIDMQKGKIFLATYFPAHTESSSDNFVLKFRIKVNEINNESCPFFLSQVFCQRDFMFFTSTLKGCTSEAYAQYGENILSGKTNDLYALGMNVKDWNSVQVTVKNKKVSISFNGAVAFTTAYQQTCGLITGLGFISNGLCEVDSIDLKTINGKDIYSNDFNQPVSASK
jgi:transcriptional regulator with XRE-family HTH domain